MERNVKIGGIVACVLLLTFLVGSIALHFSQKAHNRIELDLDREFPPEEAFAPGEIFATVLARIMEHELDSTFGWRPRSKRTYSRNSWFLPSSIFRLPAVENP